MSQDWLFLDHVSEINDTGLAISRPPEQISVTGLVVSRPREQNQYQRIGCFYIT